MTFGVKKKRDEINKPQNPISKKWFNGECHNARNTYHKVRKLYNKHKTVYHKTLLKNVSKEYKNKTNLRRYKNEKNIKLRSLKNASPKDFWKVINSIGKSKRETAPLNDLYNFFKNVNSSNINEDISNPSKTDEFVDLDSSSDINADINQPFSENEIVTAVKKSKK